MSSLRTSASLRLVSPFPPKQWALFTLFSRFRDTLSWVKLVRAFFYFSTHHAFFSLACSTFLFSPCLSLFPQTMSSLYPFFSISRGSLTSKISGCFFIFAHSLFLLSLSLDMLYFSPFSFLFLFIPDNELSSPFSRFRDASLE